MHTISSLPLFPHFSSTVPFSRVSLRSFLTPPPLLHTFPLPRRSAEHRPSRFNPCYTLPFNPLLLPPVSPRFDSVSLFHQFLSPPPAPYAPPRFIPRLSVSRFDSPSTPVARSSRSSPRQLRLFWLHAICTRVISASYTLPPLSKQNHPHSFSLCARSACLDLGVLVSVLRCSASDTLRISFRTLFFLPRSIRVRRVFDQASTSAVLSRGKKHENVVSTIVFTQALDRYLPVCCACSVESVNRRNE